ncbi:MAG: hypothetical protein HFI86_08595 [Bacilli bacterium]|nr:hypothetical protein [Bacilli bacterium]
MNIINEKYDIILPNEFGRKYTKRYKQYMYSDIEGKDGIPNYELQDFGCGPCSMATILSSIGYDLDPIEVAKLILLDEDGNLIDFYTNKESGRLGMSTLGFLYLLQELIRIKGFNLEYQLIKYSYEHPELKKEQVIDMIKHDYMALILVGPKGKLDHPRTFSNYGHYIAVTGVNNFNNEFYVANPNKTGDKQVDSTFSYETLVANMYTNTFDFLMVKNKSMVLKK